MQFRIAGSTIRITVPTWAALEARVSERLAQRKGFGIATLNLDHLVKLADDPKFREAYLAQDFVTADGNPIVWMSRLAGRPVSLIPGADALLPLARIAARQNAPVALVGSSDQSLEAAKRYLRGAVRDLDIVLSLAPPMGVDPEGDDGAAILAAVERSGARLVFLALGAPLQERLAARGRVALPSVGFACFGAGLDFLAGRQTRAPLWVRRIAMEWLWRALSQPRRLVPRYARCALILPGHLVGAVAQRLQKP